MTSTTRRQFAQIGIGAIAGLVLGGEAKSSQAPANACDCQVHMIGPADRYPMSPQRPYTPPTATPADLLAFHARLGMSRVILVQPSIYGTDNRYLLDSLAVLGSRARGIAVVSPDIGDAELDRFNRAGVRGLRVNLESVDIRNPAAAAAGLEHLSGRAAARGWHMQLYAALPVIAAIADRIGQLQSPVVIDHFGMPDAALGVGQPGFGALLELVKARKVIVKLSAPYRISKLPDYGDVAPFARALIAAGPDRMIWASDWPHTDRTPGAAPTDLAPFRKVDDVAVLGMLAGWCGDEALRRTILVDTPRKIFAFS